MQKQWFSLAELTISIALVLLVACIAMPLLAYAQEGAARLGCKGKLKRIDDAAFTYVRNNHDYTVPHVAGRLRGWPRILMHEDKSLGADAFHCPEDNVKRSNDGAPISYSLNVGHIWNCRQSLTNKKEWGPVSVLSYTAIRMSKVPQPSDTVWFVENHSANNNARRLLSSGDASLKGTYSIRGFHDNGTIANLLFMDGHVEGVRVDSWVKGDNRGIIFKDIHSPQNCVPNLP